MQKKQLCLPLESVERDESTTYYFFKIDQRVVIESITTYHPTPETDEEED